MGSGRERTISRVVLLAITPQIPHFRNALPLEVWHGLGLPGLERTREPVRPSAQHGGVLITPEFGKTRIARSSLQF